jgi:hypothetical protein
MSDEPDASTRISWPIWDLDERGLNLTLGLLLATSELEFMMAGVLCWIEQRPGTILLGREIQYLAGLFTRLEFDDSALQSELEAAGYSPRVIDSALTLYRAHQSLSDVAEKTRSIRPFNLDAEWTRESLSDFEVIAIHTAGLALPLLSDAYDRLCAAVFRHEPLWLSSKIFEQEYGISPDRIRQAAHRGHIRRKPSGVGSRWLYSWHSAQAYWPEDIAHRPSVL